MLGFQSVQPCPYQEEDIIPLVDDETIEDDINNSKNLHHTLGVDDIPPSSNFKEGVIDKNINHSLQSFFPPPFLLKEENVIDDTPP